MLYEFILTVASLNSITDAASIQSHWSRLNQLKNIQDLQSYALNMPPFTHG